MKLSVKLAIFASAVALAAPAHAATVSVDLSGATTGTLITGVGASFAQGFAAGPLALAPSGSITVAFWNPGVSPGSNSLLSQPGNAANLAMLLDGGVLANSLTFTAGSWGGGSVTATGYDLAGNVTGSTAFSNPSGYSVFNLTGIGNFAGVLFSNNTDPAGLRFQNFSYETVANGAVPEPATWALLVVGFGLVGAAMRRRQKLTVRYA